MADIKIYGTLKNATESGKVALASQIYDESKGKFQSQINEESITTRKFRYAHWNIGHFTYYDDAQGSSTPDIPSSRASEMALRFKSAINEIDADVLGVCEDDPIFDAAGNTSLSSLYYRYKDKYQGTKYNYDCNSIYSNLPLTILSVTEVLFPYAKQTRYYKLMVANLNGRTVKIIETHFDFDQTTEGSAFRDAQVAKIISDFADDEYVIISVDYNASDSSEFETFEAAGYVLANHGYIGDIVTYHGHLSPFNQLALDNIFCKGFLMTNVQVHDSTFSLSDHAAISCDLEMLV